MAFGSLAAMSRDTRIGMVTGLAIIVLIGALLSMYLDRAQSSVQPAALAALGSAFRDSLINPPTSTVPPPPSQANTPAHNAPSTGMAPRAGAAGGNSAAPAQMVMGNVYNSSINAMPTPPASFPIGFARVGNLKPVGNQPLGQTGGNSSIRTYTVKSGDTLTHIAWLCYHDGGPLAVRRIIQANSATLKNIHSTLHIGQKLIIPPATVSTSVAAHATMNLTQMAATTNTGRLPGMRRAKQAATQLIDGFFPKDSAASAPTSAGMSYKVKPHDTLAAIARKYMGSASVANIHRIMAANHISNPNKLAVGMVLRLSTTGH